MAGHEDRQRPLTAEQIKARWRESVNDAGTADEFITWVRRNPGITAACAAAIGAALILSPSIRSASASLIRQII